MPRPVIHQTDLFHPHQDPDDHWDMACVYALDCMGEFDLRGIVIDFPPPNNPGAPDALGIAQLNHITGRNVSFGVGSPVATKARSDKQMQLSGSEKNGIALVLEALRTSQEPVVINIVGSCRDVSIAGAREPELFEEKCAAIYLNAGSGSPDKGLIMELEYNVRLNPSAFAGIFDIPCPVYWMPCFEITPPNWRVEEFGTFYRFQQSEILPFLRKELQNYFAYMLTRSDDLNWLKFLEESVSDNLMETLGRGFRNMYCTGGFIHAAGKAVTCDGRIVSQDSQEQVVFGFDPIEVDCQDDGTVSWKSASTPGSRYIYHVKNIEKYASAMTLAMLSLLQNL